MYGLGMPYTRVAPVHQEERRKYPFPCTPVTTRFPGYTHHPAVLATSAVLAVVREGGRGSWALMTIRLMRVLHILAHYVKSRQV